MSETMERFIEIFHFENLSEKLKESLVKLESSGSKTKRPKLEGVIIQREGHPNKNRRIYTSLKSQMQKMKEQITTREGTMPLMYNNHPFDDEDDFRKHANLENISAMIVEVYGPDAEGYYKADIVIDLGSKGSELLAKLETGINIGISSRGYGKSNEIELNGEIFSEIPEETFVLEGFDFVLGQSVHKANNLDKKLKYEKTELPMEPKEYQVKFPEQFQALTNDITKTVEAKVREENKKELQEKEKQLIKEYNEKLAESNNNFEVKLAKLRTSLIEAGILNKEEIPQDKKDSQMESLKKQIEEMNKNNQKMQESLKAEQERSKAVTLATKLERENSQIVSFFSKSLSECLTEEEVQKSFDYQKAIVEKVLANKVNEETEEDKIISRGKIPTDITESSKLNQNKSDDSKPEENYSSLAEMCQ